MAHEIDMSNGRANFAFTGDRADIWHRLGQTIDPARATDTNYLLNVGGLEWDVEKRALHYTTKDGSARAVHDTMAQVRTDTGECVGIVSGSKYNTVQPRQIVEFYRGFLADNKLTISTLGSLRGGKVVWCLAKLGPEYGFVLPGNDRVDGYVRLQTSFDGTRSTSLVATTIRQVCANTERMIEAATTGKQYVTPHSRVFDARGLQAAFGLLGEQSRITAEAYSALAARQVSADEARKYFADLLGADLTKPEDISGHQRNKLVALASYYQGSAPGAALESSRGTAFGLLNAVTYYVDHKAPTRDVTGHGKDAARLASSWIGAGARAKERARELALALVA